MLIVKKTKKNALLKSVSFMYLCRKIEQGRVFILPILLSNKYKLFICQFI